MSSASEIKGIFAAIIADDSAAVKRLLMAHPELATAEAPEAFLSRELFHWIYKRDTALHAAAAGHRVEISKLLLSAGADPNVIGKHRFARPLHYAANGSPDAANCDSEHQVKELRLLLDAGAEINAIDKNGATALHNAVRTRCAAAVEFLLQQGADAKALNKPGSTPFHLAVQNTGRGGSGSAGAIAAQGEIIRSFLAHGLRPNLKDAKGRTVTEWARSETVKQLLGS